MCAYRFEPLLAHLSERWNYLNEFEWSVRRVKVENIAVTAVFSTFTHTQTRGLLEKVWFEYESSGINWSMSGVYVWYSQHLLDISSLECQCLNNDK